MSLEVCVPPYCNNMLYCNVKGKLRAVTFVYYHGSYNSGINATDNDNRECSERQNSIFWGMVKPYKLCKFIITLVLFVTILYLQEPIILIQHIGKVQISLLSPHFHGFVPRRLLQSTKVGIKIV